MEYADKSVPYPFTVPRISKLSAASANADSNDIANILAADLPFTPSTNDGIFIKRFIVTYKNALTIPFISMPPPKDMSMRPFIAIIRLTEKIIIGTVTKFAMRAPFTPYLEINATTKRESSEYTGIPLNTFIPAVIESIADNITEADKKHDIRTAAPNKKPFFTTTVFKLYNEPLLLPEKSTA